MKKVLITTVLAAALLAPLAMAAEETAPRGPRGFGGMGEGNFVQMLLGRMGQELNLTEEQKASIQKIADESKDAVEANREAVRTAMQNLNDAADKGDEAAITAAGKAAGEALTKQALQRAEVAKKVNAVLTPEQQAKFEQMKADMRTRMQERRGQMMQGEGPGPRGPRGEGRGPRPEGAPGAE
jgi:Spy/CpxP family protein refolding chaperone